MPKPVKKSRLFTDPNLSAADLVRRSLEAHDAPSLAIPDFSEQLSVYMSKLGKKGGKASGAKRMQMPKEKRREIASKAARKRWDAVAKRKAAGKKR